jgi:hypothetical protein
MSVSEENAFGFKRVSSANWLTIDPAWEGVLISLSGSDSSTGWVEDLSRMELDAMIPLSIRKVFEVARGTLIYGLMFYPLLTLGAEQLFRVLEAAASLQCHTLNAPSQVRTFARKIDWLTSQKLISLEERTRWHAMRKLRNLGSHPTEQAIFSIGMTLTVLDSTAELINMLFLQKNVSP